MEEERECPGLAHLAELAVVAFGGQAQIGVEPAVAAGLRFACEREGESATCDAADVVLASGLGRATLRHLIRLGEEPREDVRSRPLDLALGERVDGHAVEAAGECLGGRRQGLVTSRTGENELPGAARLVEL